MTPPAAPPPRLVVLAGGVGGARYLLGVREHARARAGGTRAEDAVTAIVNVGDDAWVAGLRLSPDLDSVMYTLGGAVDGDRGWGRAGESYRVAEELAAYGVGWPWFTLGDLDLATLVARSSLLRDGLPLSAATERLARRWDPGVRLLPASDQEVETHVQTERDGAPALLHFQEWWVRHRAAPAARAFVQRGVEGAAPAPGVREAIRDADVVLLAPSNPVVSIGTILGIPGIAEALRATDAPVVGVSPLIGGAALRGMAETCLATIGVAATAGAVAGHYGARSRGGILDGWLMDPADAAQADAVRAAGIEPLVRPILFSSPAETAAIAADAVALGERLAGRRS